MKEELIIGEHKMHPISTKEMRITITIMFGNGDEKWVSIVSPEDKTKIQDVINLAVSKLGTN